jgi:general secretion pathway protein G
MLTSLSEEENVSLFVTGLIAGIVGILSLVQTIIRKMPDKTRKKIAIVLSDVMAGGIGAVLLGRFLEEPTSGVAGGIAGGIVGFLEILFRGKIAKWVSDEKTGDVFPFWVAAWLAGNIGGIGIAVIPMVMGIVLIAIMFNNVVPLLINFIGRLVFILTSPLLILVRYKTILCNHCLRYTSPLDSTHRLGVRYCEHCQGDVEYTSDPGKVIFSFGNISLNPSGRVFLLSNPDVEHQEQPVDVSEVYLDPKTCDRRLVERFITYILHYPPRHDRQSLQLFYTGKLEELGTNLKNVLQNNFEHIEKFQIDEQRTDTAEGFRVPSQLSQKQTQKDWGRRTKLVKSEEIESAPSGQPTPSELQTSSSQRTINIIKGASWGIVSSLLVAGLLSLSFVLFEFEFWQIVLPESFSIMLGLLILSGFVRSIVIGIENGIRISGEVITMLGILVIIAAIAIPNLLTGFSRSKRGRTVADMRAIGTALGSYQVDNDLFPILEGGKFKDIAFKTQLADGLTTSYYEGAEKDAWRKDFYYSSDGYGYTLKSFGKDRKPGGNGGFNSDIVYINGSFVAPSAIVE